MLRFGFCRPEDVYVGTSKGVKKFDTNAGKLDCTPLDEPARVKIGGELYVVFAHGYIKNGECDKYFYMKGTLHRGIRMGEDD